MSLCRRMVFGLWVMVILGALFLLAGCEQQPMGVATAEPDATVASASGILTATEPPAPTPTKTALPPSATVTARPSLTPTRAATATVVPSPTPTATTPRPTLVPVEPGLIEHGDRSQPWVALTFDAWQTADLAAGYDAAVIEFLTETQTPATLLLGGLWMRDHVTQTQALAGVPHFELGNLSWSYADLADLPEEAAMAEIDRAQDLFHTLTGRQPALFRLPFGSYQEETLEIIASQGLQAIQWDVVTGDADPNILAADIARVVEDGAQNGSIVVLHMNGQGWHTAEALPAILKALEEGGFELVTVSQLLGEGPPPEATPTVTAAATAASSATAAATAGANATASATAGANATATGTAAGTATAAATATPSGGNATVSKGLVNVRQEATTEATVLGTLEEGNRLTVLCSLKGQRVDAYDTDKWFRIEFEEGQGYILAFLVTPDSSVAKCE